MGRLINEHEANVAVQKVLESYGFKPCSDVADAVWNAIENVPTAFEVNNVIDEFMDKVREQKKTVSACEGDKYLTGIFNGLQQAMQIAEDMRIEQEFEKEIINMEITGKYKKDSNFTTVYCNNKIYTIARGTGDWSCLAVGECTSMGQVLTQDVYDSWASECSKEGTFVLS